MKGEFLQGKVAVITAASRGLGQALIAVMLALVVPQLSHAEKKYGPGVTDTEIKIGQTMPYSGPLSAFGTIGRAEAAYFNMVNAQGGVNGRRIRLISLDDGYSPPCRISGSAGRPSSTENCAGRPTSCRWRR